MEKPDIDDLLVLSEEQAVLKHYDYLNYGWFRIYLLLFFAWGVLDLVITVLVAEKNLFFGLLTPTLFLVSPLVLFFSRKKAWFRDNFYQVASSYLLILMLGLFLNRYDFQGYNAWVLILCGIPLMFSFRTGTILLLYLASTGLGVFESLTYKELDTAYIASAVVVLVFNGGCFVFTFILTRSRRDSFLEIWEREANRHRERLRMKQELEQARDIQLSLLPHGNPDFQRLDLSCSSTPATEVGGDYYEYFPLSDHRIAIVVGDVSGHGVSSGLVLSGVRSCLYLLREELPQPGELLGKLNRMLKETTAPQMFMTFIMVIFDLEKGEMTIANAGHPPTIHYRSKENAVVEHRYPALPLGGVKSAKYKEVTVPFQSGDIFVIYTDGLTEAHAGDSAFEYGEGRLKGKVKDLALTVDDAEAMRSGVLADVHEFMDGHEQDDDITLVVVRIT